MTDRKCGTCKHYEPAPIWRKGWCRNPLLYSPQQSHLVGEDDLDCDRGMGNYWEPLDATADDDPVAATQEAAAIGGAGMSRLESTPTEAPLRFAHGSAAGGPAFAGGGGEMSHFSGTTGYRGDGDEDDDDVRRVPSYGDRSRSPFGGGGPERQQYTYYADERYWTDYLRIAAPVLGVILIVVLGWFVLTRALGGGDDEDNGTAAGASTATVIAGETPTAQIITGTPVPAGGTTTPTTDPGPSAPTTLGVGATVEVSGTDGSGVNLRAAPTTDGDIVASLEEGTELQITGEAVEADGYTWWPVTSDEFTGYVVEDFIELAN